MCLSLACYCICSERSSRMGFWTLIPWPSVPRKAESMNNCIVDDRTRSNGVPRLMLTRWSSCAASDCPAIFLLWAKPNTSYVGCFHHFQCTWIRLTLAHAGEPTHFGVSSHSRSFYQVSFTVKLQELDSRLTADVHTKRNLSVSKILHIRGDWYSAWKLLISSLAHLSNCSLFSGAGTKL